MLLILRQLYYEKSKEVTQLNQIIVTIGEIHESMRGLTFLIREFQKLN